MHPLTDTWQINQRINELLLSGISESCLADVSKMKGRSVGQQFAHLHNVRLMWLQVAAPELLVTQKKIEKDEPLTLTLIDERLRQSAGAIGKLLDAGFESGKIKGFKPHPQAFLGYMLAHEAHHRGQMLMILKENKHLPDKKILYGLWEWGTH